MCLSSRGFALTAAMVVCASPAAAQVRRTLDRNDPEAQLMGYYAAAMAFSPIGLPDKDGRLEFGAAGSLIPSLSLEDRLVAFGGTKAEDSNKCPVFPRLVASRTLGRIALELGYTPAVQVCGVTASVFAAALSNRFVLGPEWDGLIRLSGMTGSLKASITCSQAFTQDSTDQTCYQGTPSDDRMAPTSLSLDFAAGYQGWRHAGFEPYVACGFRYERVDFDVNYTRAAGAFPAIDDHQRLRANLSRVQIAAGTSWEPVAHLKLGAEAYYAPGAFLTLRGRASIALGGPR